MNQNRTALLSFIVLMVTGCCIDGSGDIITENRSVDEFSKVDIDLSGKIIVRKGESHRVTVKTDDNLMDNIGTKVKGNTLHIDVDDAHCIDPTSLTITVRTPEIQRIEIDGSADVVIKDAFETDTMSVSIDGSGDITSQAVLTADTLNLDIDGSGDIDLVVDVVDIDSTIDGSGDIRLEGTALSHAISIDGSGDIKAYGLDTIDTIIDISGSGSCQVTAEEQLDVVISGSGDVYYRGDPSVNQKISGSGTVADKN